MTNEIPIWISDDAKRKEKYRQILATGDRLQLIRLIKTLHLYGQERKNEGKKLHSADERFMKEAEKMLYEEFSHVLGIHQDQVLPFILEQMEIKEKK
ncbi:hypothetical protein SDC9_198030 [bioreactor metagenome]|uniref:CarD C-terminal domain-containing protein n=1 Tax=bioreactor metagenome TaxID=1076179 RepID=A0A645IPY4_9ZZZZ